MNDKDFDRLLDEALNIPIPDGLAERLEKQVEQYAAREKRRRIRRFYWPASAAAIALLCVGIFLQTGKQPSVPADTYTDPVEAAIAAEKALAFMSAQLNKGLAQVSTAGEEFEKVNKVIDKHLKK
ncbi:MAG: DUF3379 domain-containing protein [Tannerellaceae bacterium]|jgi:bacteriorhodopsin|nr:DUF3379 domain-containing protein [Tannerellaceae bacterium]